MLFILRKAISTIFPTYAERLGVAFGFSPEFGKIMSYPAVIPFYRIGLRFLFSPNKVKATGFSR